MPIFHRRWKAVLDYLKGNPGFFTYRFGVSEGLALGVRWRTCAASSAAPAKPG
jgi:hypothetical protein